MDSSIVGRSTKLKRPGKPPGLRLISASGDASTSVVKGKQISSSGLQIAGRHLARLHVALKFEADLLTFNELAHSCALDSGDVNEGVSAAVVGLDKTKTLGGIEPFYCASGNDEPFQSIDWGTARQMPHGYEPTIFEREVRLKRGANHAVDKLGKQKIDLRYIGCKRTRVNV